MQTDSVVDPVSLLIVLGAVAGGLVQGLSGFAFGLVAMAFWAWAVPAQLAGPMVVFGSLVGQLIAIRTVRGASFRLVLPFIGGGALGVPIGAFLLPYIDQTAFKLLIGVLLTVWCPAMLFVRELPRIEKGGRAADAAAGFAGGVMGGLGGLSGPAPILWCTLRGWHRDTQRAIFQGFNISMHTLTFSIYVTVGLITTEALGYFAIVAPAMLMPALIGARLYRRLSVDTFRRLVLMLLLASGLMLLSSSLPALIGR